MLKRINSFFFSYCDSAERWQVTIQDPATPIAEGMFFFHNYLMFFLVAIGIFVVWMLGCSIYFSNNKPIKFSHSNILEIIWTIIPAVILLFIAIPSFTLLYSLDELVNPIITLKIIGHQWYWSYEYSDYLVSQNKSMDINFDSYMVQTNDLGFGSLRLLEVDHRVVLPIKTHIRLLVSSSDVLHSWAVPSFGLKIDACPGRLSQGALFIRREGIYYGQCSEICGVNHGFMPIVVKAVSPQTFLKWINIKNDN
jgi:cytochrome c oxidase subunit 2